MNKKRRKMLKKCIESLQCATSESEYEYIKSVLESIFEEEEEARDNTPDGLDCTDRYYESEEAIEVIEGSIEYINDALSSIEDQNIKEAEQNKKEAVELLRSIM